MAEFSPVPGANHDLPGVGAGKGGCRIRPVLHPSRKIEDAAVAAGVLVELGEAEGAARKTCRHRVLDAELRVVVARGPNLVRGRLTDDRDGLFRDEGGHPFHIAGVEVVIACDRDGRVRAAVQEMAGGKGLDRDPVELPGLAETGRRERVVAAVTRPRAEVAAEEPETPFVGQAGRDETLAREIGRREARHRRPAGVEPLGPCTVRQELHAPGRGAERNPLRHDELPRIEPEQAARPERAGERPDDPGRMEALPVEAAARHRADAGPRLHRDHVGGDHRGAGCAEPFAERQRAGKGARRRVDDARDVGIVVVEAVDEEPVRHRRIAKREPSRMTDDGSSARGRGREIDAGERLDAAEGRPGEVEPVRRECDADRVEDEMTGPDANPIGDVFVAQPAHECGEIGCNIF